MRGKRGKYSRSLQHDTAHTGHGAQAVCGVLYGQGLILMNGKKTKPHQKIKNYMKLNEKEIRQKL